MAERGARHHRERHRADGAAGPGMNSRARRDEVDRGERCKKKPGGHEGIGDVQDQDEPVDKGPVAGPAGEPDEMQDSCKAKRSRHVRAFRNATHAMRANVATSIAMASNRPKGVGSRPGPRRASQLRVKLGTMRPPIKLTSVTTSAMPARVETSARPLKWPSR